MKWLRNFVWMAGLVLGSIPFSAPPIAHAQASPNYLDNTNQFLSDAQTRITSATEKTVGRMPSYPSPTGSGIAYVRSEIDAVNYAPFKGETYQAKVPATLDLAERARLFIQGVTGCVDPKADYEIFGWMGHVKEGCALLSHTYNDYNGGQPKWMQNLPYARTMSGSDLHLDVDKKMMETMFRMIGPDGLYYIPVIGAPWHEAFDSKQRVAPGVTQHFDSWPSGRALLCLVSWFSRDRENRALKQNIERMIKGLSAIAQRQGDAAWIPEHFTNLDLKPTSPLPVRGMLSQGSTLPGLAKYYELTGYAPARELGQAMVNYWLGPADLLKPDGSWVTDHSSLHFHGTLFTLEGLADWALAVKDDELLQKVAKAYEFGRAGGIPEVGWFPEALPALHPYSEPCCIGDMAAMATRLSAHGAGDYWEDAEHYVRNLLAEGQLTDTWFIRRMANMDFTDSDKVYQAKAPLEDNLNVDQRMRGVFAGMLALGGQFQPVSSHCCTGNGFRGMYYVWNHIVSTHEGALQVNMLLNRASQWADVNSFLPYAGRVNIEMKQDMPLQVRIPSWVAEPTQANSEVDGKVVKGSARGRYLDLGPQRKGQKITIRFPLPDHSIRRTIHWKDDKGEMHSEDYTLRMRGFNVVDLWPRKESIVHQFFTNTDYRQDRILWQEVTRFAPEQEHTWD